MTEPLHVETSFEGRSVCLALCGELTYGTVALFDEHLVEVFASTRPRLVLDVRRLQFCDSVGLSALLGAQRRADLDGGRLVLRGVHGMLERVLRITGTGAMFTVVGFTGVGFTGAGFTGAGGEQADRADPGAAADADRAGGLA